MLIPSATFATEYWKALKYVVGTYVRNVLVAQGKKLNIKYNYKMLS